LDHTDEPNRYVIRLVDRKQIAALALAEGLSKPIPLEPIAVLYDEGSRSGSRYITPRPVATWGRQGK
jgi:hypothetical protein